MCVNQTNASGLQGDFNSIKGILFYQKTRMNIKAKYGYFGNPICFCCFLLCVILYEKILSTNTKAI